MNSFLFANQEETPLLVFILVSVVISTLLILYYLGKIAMWCETNSKSQYLDRCYLLYRIKRAAQALRPPPPGKDLLFDKKPANFNQEPVINTEERLAELISWFYHRPPRSFRFFQEPWEESVLQEADSLAALEAQAKEKGVTAHYWGHELAKLLAAAGFPATAPRNDYKPSSPDEFFRYRMGLLHQALEHGDPLPPPDAYRQYRALWESMRKK